VGLAMDRLRNLRVRPDGRELSFDSGSKDHALWMVDNLLKERGLIRME